MEAIYSYGYICYQKAYLPIGHGPRWKITKIFFSNYFCVYMNLILRHKVITKNVGEVEKLLYFLISTYSQPNVYNLKGLIRTIYIIDKKDLRGRFFFS